MTPRIDLAGLVPGESDPNEERLRALQGLGLVHFEVYPHYIASDISVRCLSCYTLKQKSPVYAFSDGAGIVVENGSTSFYGEATVFSKGELFRLP